MISDGSPFMEAALTDSDANFRLNGPELMGDSRRGVSIQPGAYAFTYEIRVQIVLNCLSARA